MICKRCQVDKPADAFSRCSACASGRQPKCRDCDREVNTAWRRAHVVERKLYDQGLREKKRLYKKANPHKVAEHKARRRARMRGSSVPLTPAEVEEMRRIYKLRAVMSELRGEPYHVDHVVPLAKGGKHHPSNLEVIPASENYLKGSFHL
jgi:hypothetical protein